MGPPQLGDDALAQLVKVDPERPKQRSSCASIAVRQPDVRNDPPVPPRLPCTAHRLASILQHPKHHVHWADLTMPERARLLAGQLQGPLGEERRATQRRPHHPPAPPTTPAGHPPGRLPAPPTPGARHAPPPTPPCGRAAPGQPHCGPRRSHPAGHAPARGSGGRTARPRPGQGRGSDEPAQRTARTPRATSGTVGCVLLRGDRLWHGHPQLGRHRIVQPGRDRLPRPALGAGVLHLQGLQHLHQPRRAATAASPTSGSWLLVAAATWVTSLEAASPMKSIYIDPAVSSIVVDPALVRNARSRRVCAWSRAGRGGPAGLVIQLIGAALDKLLQERRRSAFGTSTTL